MPQASLVSFDHPAWLVGSLCILAIALIVGWIRRIDLSWKSAILFFTGLLLLAGASGGLIWRRPHQRTIAVMVDLSPSTRGALYRDRAALDDRIHQLLGDLPFRAIAFSQAHQPLPADPILPDIPVENTLFSPESADAILLFSDGNFPLPTFAPPTYPVIDPALEHPVDAAISRLEIRSQAIVATVNNSGPARSLVWSGAKPIENDPVSGAVIRSAQPMTASDITASLSPGDAWPENDSLSIRPAPPLQLEQWWVGDGNAPQGWRHFSAAELPADSAMYLNPAVIVLDNVSADAIGAQQQDRLMQYTRDLGGGLVIVGGPHAFAGGEYQGTPLDTLSPLASTAPQPATHWILLVDSSGSMADSAGNGNSKWQIETAALTQLLPLLPPADRVSLGSFAESIDWWSSNKSARDTLSLSLPPASATPHGPTNLQPALNSIMQSADGSLATQLLLMTDAQTQLENPAQLAVAMNSKNIHLQVFALGNGQAMPALQAIANSTGGYLLQQFDPQQWVTGAKQLLRSALPDQYFHQPAEVIFSNALASLGTRSIEQWNRTWLKPQATLLAKSDAAPMAARWQVGLGRVSSIAYPASPDEVSRLTQEVATPPRDPRFKVTWETGPRLRIKVDAVGGGNYLNGEEITVQPTQLQAPGVESPGTRLEQSASGQYQVDLPAPRTTTLMTVWHGRQMLDRFAVAARYAPEFNAIGNNRDNLQRLADQTAGMLIEPGPAKPLDFRWRTESVSLASPLAIVGALLIALSLIQRVRH